MDAIAGAESLISRVISQKFAVPVAHAPAFLPIEEDDSFGERWLTNWVSYE